MRFQSTSNNSFTQFVLMTAMLVSPLFSTKTVCAQAMLEVDKAKMIRNALVEMITKEKLPGMIAAITNAEGVVAVGSAGVRKAGSDKVLTDDNLVHIGSCTKAMTCLMLATLVADGTLTWKTTLIEVFPKLKNSIHPDYHHVTLWQLVTHHAGLPANAKDWWVHPKKEIKERRLVILKENLKNASIVKPGEYHYSNLGYMVAGCIAESLTGSTWESLMKKRLFGPLGMISAGFGPPGISNQIDQPWGHVKSEGSWQPKKFDNAEAHGPAGRVHCTLEDWAKFISLQLPRNKALILDRKHLDKLIDSSSNYAGGWIVVQRPWAKGKALSHSGSNKMWYATVWVAPKLNRGFIVATNSCDKNSPAICDKMIGKLIEIDRKTQTH
jgi:CubicO group peptidase (beta-lactamase class C family)